MNPNLRTPSIVLSLCLLLCPPPPASAGATAPIGVAVSTGAELAADAARRQPPLWQPPLGLPLRIAAPYSLPNGPYQAGHRGIDLPAAPGAAVRAPAAGTISFVGTVVDRAVLSIRLDARTVLSLEPVTSEKHAGETVSRGETVGVMDSGGHCSADCVHLGVRVDGNYANPLRFLRPKPVLLPW